MDDTNDSSSLSTRCITRYRRRQTVDATMAQLVRTVLEEQWAPHTAAQTMLEFTDHDRGVLRRVRAKIALSTLAATSQVADQALATLDLAIGTASEQ